MGEESEGSLIDGSEALLVKGCSWSETRAAGGGLVELWSEEEERDSVLRAGEGEVEEGWE